MRLRKLRPAGRKIFAEWIEYGGSGEAPTPLLTSELESESIPKKIEVSNTAFETRFEMGVYLVETLKGLGSDVWFDEGLWDWLSLHYIDQLCATSDGVRKVQARERYVLELKNRKWSRHLVRMNWLCVQEHGESAKVLLTTAPHGHSDVLEQLAGQQELFGARSLIAAACQMYWSDATNDLKRGAQGKGGGTPRRLRRIMSQFRRTWDPHSMTPAQILGILPAEFDRWKKVAPSQKNAAVSNIQVAAPIT